MRDTLPTPAPEAPRHIIDPCPVCAGAVTSVHCHRTGNHSTSHASPCGHAVAVTIWPDHVELATT